MTIIQEFVGRYRREYDFFAEAARSVSLELETRLEATGIRSIVTYRAKRPDRLEDKLNKRAEKRVNGYETIEDIYTDIPDLAGARVALYFPGDRDKVGNIIHAAFKVVRPPKRFPDSSQPNPTFTSVTGEPYPKRFSGYWATHFLVSLLENSLKESQKRYSDAKIEVQVASVLMHAWSEVEHDLIYKPLQGPLSIEEYSILDTLNGMVQSGELSLEHLQRAADTRVAKHDNPFSNHYDLAAYLFEKVKPIREMADEPFMGRVDVLFDLLTALNIASPDGISTYIAARKDETERRPIAEQLIDEIISADTSRYDVYSKVRSQREGKSPYAAVPHAQAPSEQERAIGFFITQWIRFETWFRTMGKERGVDERLLLSPSPRLLNKLQLVDRETAEEIEHIRRVRNHLVHGVEVPDAPFILREGERLKAVLDKLPSVGSNDGEPDAGDPEVT